MDWPEYIPAKHFLDIYKDTISNIGLKDRSMATALGTALRKYFGQAVVKKRMSLPPFDPETGKCFSDHMHPKSVQAVYLLPSLEAARDMFAEVTGLEFNIPEDDVDDQDGDDALCEFDNL